MTYYATCLKRSVQTLRNKFDANFREVGLKYRLSVNSLLCKDVYIHGTTQKFGEFKQGARTGCRMPFRR